MSMFCGLPISVAADPTLAAQARPTRNGLGSSLRRVQHSITRHRMAGIVILRLDDSRNPFGGPTTVADVNHFPRSFGNGIVTIVNEWGGNSMRPSLNVNCVCIGVTRSGCSMSL